MQGCSGRRAAKGKGTRSLNLVKPSAAFVSDACRARGHARAVCCACALSVSVSLCLYVCVILAVRVPVCWLLFSPTTICGRDNSTPSSEDTLVELSDGVLALHLRQKHLQAVSKKCVVPCTRPNATAHSEQREVEREVERERERQRDAHTYTHTHTHTHKLAVSLCPCFILGRDRDKMHVIKRGHYGTTVLDSLSVQLANLRRSLSTAQVQRSLTVQCW